MTDGREVRSDRAKPADWQADMGMDHYILQNKIAQIEEAVGFWRHFGANNAGVVALCDGITAILNGDDTSHLAVPDSATHQPVD